MSYLLQVLKCLEVGWNEVGTAIQYMYLFVFGTLRLRVQGKWGMWVCAPGQLLVTLQAFAADQLPNSN